MTRRTKLAVVWTAPPLVVLAVCWAVYARFHIAAPERLDAAARDALAVRVRAALESKISTAGELDPAPASLARPIPGGGPLIATVWTSGRERARGVGRGATLAVAVDAAIDSLLEHPRVKRRRVGQYRAARVQFDLVVGRAPLAAKPFEALSLNPGVEGLGVEVAGAEHFMLPGDLVRRRALNAATPLSFARDVRFGLDVGRADRWLRRRAALSSDEWDAAPRRYFRFLTDSFVELPERLRRDPGPDTVALWRGRPPAPEPTADTLRAAALSGAQYLVRHLNEAGRYIYETNLATGKSTNPDKGPYSLPRHAGTTYFLAEVLRVTGDDDFREPTERAIGHLAELVSEGGCKGRTADGREFACVVDRGRPTASLGSSALAVVALAEYQRATGDARHAALAARLGEWILSMQRPDGSFRHRYDVASGRPDEDAMLLYFSGEAALALARMHAVTGDRRYLDAAERGLDWLVSWYDFFAGSFFFGEEHWTCIAAAAALPHLDHERYRAFCERFAEFSRRTQQHDGEILGRQADLDGAYGFTPFWIPINGAAGSRTEAMISTLELQAHHGREDPALREQILASLHFAMRQQIRPESDWNVPVRARGLGGISATAIDPVSRIDNVQHVGSAMLRMAELLGEPGAKPKPETQPAGTKAPGGDPTAPPGLQAVPNPQP